MAIPKGRIARRFRFTSTFQLAALPFAITPGRCHVLLDQDTFVAHFGPWQVRTVRDNVASAELVGPFSLLEVAGPAAAFAGQRAG